MFKAQAIGRLPKEVDLRYTTTGRAVANFTLICKIGTDAQGNDISSSAQCVLWNKPAEAIATYTTTGSLLSVEGNIETSSYETNDGQKKYKTQIIVDTFEFLETRSVTEQRREKNNSKHDNQSHNQQQHMESDPYP